MRTTISPFFFSFCLLLSPSSASKLNVPRVLLPFSEEGVDFVLEADQPGGCFKWKSARPEAVSVTLLEEDSSRGCSARASVSPAKSGAGAAKVQSVVTAEDVNSPGHILRCDVIVDSIHSLQIVTRTHELFLEEAPEEFYVRAYDDQGNEFTTVQKMVFKWTIDNIVKRSTGGSAAENIRFISFRDSTYAHEESLRQIEAAGGQGGKVLLEGIRTGSSRVAVRPVSGLYSARVPPAEVNVMVVANLYLVPGSAYIMLGATLAYKAEQIKSNKIHDISLPSQQYFLTVADSEKASLEAESATVTGMALGSTEVSLRDGNVAPDDQTVRPPSGDLHVVMPAYITISVNPHKNWNVVVGGWYDLVVDIFDADNNRIFPSDNVEVELTVPKEMFNVMTRKRNGTWHKGTPVNAGTAEVSATLVGVRDPEGRLIELEQPLHATGQLLIFDKIILHPDISIFPWDPLSNPVYSVKYSMEGSAHDLTHQWHSANQSVATVSQNGVARTGQAERSVLGETVITAAMHRASHNYGQAKILIVPVTGLTLLDGVLETEIGSGLALPVSLLGRHEGEDHRFTQCHKLPLEVHVTDTKVFEEGGVQMDLDRMATFEELSPEACTALDMRAKAPGFSNVEVSYTLPTLEGGQLMRLTDKATIAAYKPLTPAQPSSGKTLLGVDASLQIVWTGGPLAWVKKPEYHFSKVTVKNPDVARAGPRVSLRGASGQTTSSSTSSPGGGGSGGTAAGVYAFDVTCLALGTTEVTLEVGNRASGSLQRPVVATSTVTVECGQPDSLTLSPELPHPTGTVGGCPLAARTGRVPALSYEDLVIRVAVFDVGGRRFDNFSASGLSWSMAEGGVKDGARLKLTRGVEHSGTKHPMLGFRLAEEGTQTLLVGAAKRSGFVDITATMDNGILGFGSVHGELHLNLVDDASVDPASTGVFNHPDNMEFVQVRDGSGYFEVANGNAAVAESSYVPGNQTVKVKPIADGDVVLTVRDLCLPSKRSPRVHKVELLMSDKVQKAKTVQAQVKLLDRHGKQLAPSAHRFLQVQVLPATGHVRVHHARDGSPGDLLFTVKGVELGETTVVAGVAFGASRASSAPASIHVFPPLELEPRNITLIVGAKFQVKTVGGPLPDSTLEFSLENGKVAETNSVGLVEAMTLGTTKLVGRAVGFDKVTGKKISFSEDQVDVHVVKFHGIRVQTPLRRLRVGAEMPVAAVGVDVDNQNAFSFGTALPKLDLEWGASNADVADLVGVFHRSGFAHGRHNEGVMRLIAKKPGRVTIKLKARITESLAGADKAQFDGDRKFEHQVEIHVFEDLSLRSPLLPDRDTLLMAPDSEFQLATNRDRGGARHLHYAVVSSSTKGDAVSVTSSGVVKSGRSLGSSLILVEATEDFGVVQRTSLVVEVKPVHYMMINVKEAFSPLPDAHLSQLPLGLSLPLWVSYHDNTGARFDSVGLPTDYRPSRFDSLVVSEGGNDTVVAELAREEFTVLRTWGGELQDFVIFNVGKGIAPTDLGTVLIGDVIDLDNLVVSGDVSASSSSSDGRWKAEPAGMAEVDESTGVAVVLRAGRLRFSYFPLSSSERQRTTLDVGAETPARLSLGATQLLTRRPTEQFLPFVVVKASAADGTGGGAAGGCKQECNFHAVAAKKEGEMEADAADAVIASDLFECHARFLSSENKLEDYFAVQAVFNFKMRSYACRFAPLPALFQSQASLLEDEMELEVAPKYSSRLGGVKADKIKFRFISGFHVQTEKIDLTNVEPSSRIQIQGISTVLNSLKVVPSHEEFLSLGREFSEGISTTVIPVHLNSAYWAQVGSDLFGASKEASELYITVSSSLTSQTVRVPVTVRFSAEGACAAAAGAGELGWASLLYFLLAHYQTVLFLLLSCAACVVVTRMCLGKSAFRGGAAAGAGAHGGPAGDTSMRPIKGPLVGSPGVAQVGSPLNLSNADNKPYLWTVDNSPIYGSPSVRRRRTGDSPRSLTQYSYTDM